MKPVQVTIDVPNAREDVFDFLDVMANHEPFTNHVMRDWEYSGPDRGIGSKARVHVTAAGRTDTIDIEVVAAERPASIVEQNIGAGGKRVANGTYTLAELPGGGTRITFSTAGRRRRSASGCSRRSSAGCSAKRTSGRWSALPSSSRPGRGASAPRADAPRSAA